MANEKEFTGKEELNEIFASLTTIKEDNVFSIFTSMGNVLSIIKKIHEDAFKEGYLKGVEIKNEIHKN